MTWYKLTTALEDLSVPLPMLKVSTDTNVCMPLRLSFLVPPKNVHRSGC